MPKFRITDDGKSRMPSGLIRTRPSGLTPTIEALTRDLAVKHGRAENVLQKWKYWRVGWGGTSHGATGWPMHEIEMIAQGVNVGPLATVTALLEVHGLGNNSNGPGRLNDGDTVSQYYQTEYQNYGFKADRQDWIQFAFSGSGYQIDAIKLYYYQNTATYEPEAYEIWVSNNAQSWFRKQTIARDGGQQGTRTLTITQSGLESLAADQSYRYWRVFPQIRVAPSENYYFVEEIRGYDAESGGSIIIGSGASGVTVTSNSSAFSMPIANALDGNNATYWNTATNGTSRAQYMKFDFGGTPKRLRRLELDYLADNGGRWEEFLIQVSSDDVNWSTLKRVAGLPSANNISVII